MNRILLATLLFYLTAGPAVAQGSHTAATDFSRYRPVGEVKAWSFVAKDSAIGQLFSTVKRKVKINGAAGFEIEQNLELDYNKIGTERLLTVKGSHFVSEKGTYLGDKMEITVNREAEELELERDEGVIEGFYTRGGNKIKREFELTPDIFAADLLFLDMCENFFAMRDFKVGDTIVDSFFVPQTMMIEKLSAVVEMFGLISLYNQVKDSAFVVRLIQPQGMMLFINKQGHLVKADYLSRQMKAYLDLVRNLPAESLSQPEFTFSKFMKLVPLYALYLLFGGVALVFFAGAHVYRLNLYQYLIIGGIFFIAAVFTQIPIQIYLGKSVYLANINSGGSPYFWAIVPALPAGIIQEFLKLGAIFLALKFLKIDKSKILFYGAAIGAGFGFFESCYLISQFPNAEIWSMNLLERGFQILFHTSSGIILAAALTNPEYKKKIIYVIIAILVNTWLRYVPVFAQKAVFEPQLLYIFQPLASIALMVYAVSMIKRTKHC